MVGRPFIVSANLFLPACRVAVFAIIALTWPGGGFHRVESATLNHNCIF
jgi:hypothetical protein